MARRAGQRVARRADSGGAELAACAEGFAYAIASALANAYAFADGLAPDPADGLANIISFAYVIDAGSSCLGRRVPFWCSSASRGASRGRCSLKGAANRPFGRPSAG